MQVFELDGTYFLVDLPAPEFDGDTSAMDLIGILPRIGTRTHDAEHWASPELAGKRLELNKDYTLEARCGDLSCHQMTLNGEHSACCGRVTKYLATPIAQSKPAVNYMQVICKHDKDKICGNYSQYCADCPFSNKVDMYHVVPTPNTAELTVEQAMLDISHIVDSSQVDYEKFIKIKQVIAQCQHPTY